MKVLLLHPDRDPAISTKDDPKVPGYAQDLELGVLVDAACGDDRYMRSIFLKVFDVAFDNDVPGVLHRQAVLKDCLAQAGLVRDLLVLCAEPFGREASWTYSLFGRDPAAKVSSSVRTLQSCLGLLARMRDKLARHAVSFQSAGLRNLTQTLAQNLDDDYLAATKRDLEALTFRRGVLLSASLGEGGKGMDVKLRVPQPGDLSWWQHLLHGDGPSLTYQLHPRDQAGAQAFTDLQNLGLAHIADAVFESANHVLGFIGILRQQLAFYVACLNLHHRLAGIGEDITFPEAFAGARHFACSDLRDTCLSLTLGKRAIGNTVEADGKAMVMVTGVNRGGKSTFLRSVGLAQLMMQAGLFVTADRFSASLRTGLFTHFKREEDREMESGKFDEELARLNAVADDIRPGGLFLFNESFAATNEREGAAIAREIATALMERDVEVFFVTHMYELARGFLDDPRILFLRADRGSDGGRGFRLGAGPPDTKSFGVDLYRRIFQVGAPELEPCGTDTS